MPISCKFAQVINSQEDKLGYYITPYKSQIVRHFKERVPRSNSYKTENMVQTMNLGKTDFIQGETDAEY